jgi:3'(2'), 5'-bisphosphate nucleotidase
MEAQRYWLIDPLDGTKDFLVGNDEFTVNIALIEQQRPVLGVVFAPAIDELYVGVLKLGAWSDIAGVCSSCVAAGKSAHIRMAVSRFHDHPDVDIFAASNAINERLSIGSSLKYARLASGDVDVFPRLVGSSEWDTAAGQAVLEAAGGNVFDWHTGEPLRYGKANRRNPRLLALRAPYLFADFTLKYYEQELL